MKITVDKNITFGYEAFSTHGDVELVDGRNLERSQLSETDALIVRSITRVNRELLEGTPVRFVATATIGTDHFDKEWLDEAGIKYFSAPGCNATAVTEYFLAVLARIVKNKNIKLGNTSLGIVGVGNIGTRVAKAAKILGMKVILNDPPRAETENSGIFSSLDEALECDIITFHTPFDKSGKFKTFHLLDHHRLNNLKPGTTIINASRGAVIDNSALLTRYRNYNDLMTILDVWENEPAISTDLLNHVFIGTPHIAGYSFEGKVNGTIICYENFCRFYNLPATWSPELPSVNNNEIIDKSGNIEDGLFEIFNKIYNVKEDDKMLRAFDGEIGVYFDKLRKNYPVRRESKAYNIVSEIPELKELFNYLQTI